MSHFKTQQGLEEHIDRLSGSFDRESPAGKCFFHAVAKAKRTNTVVEYELYGIQYKIDKDSVWRDYVRIKYFAQNFEWDKSVGPKFPTKVPDVFIEMNYRILSITGDDRYGKYVDQSFEYGRTGKSIEVKCKKLQDTKW